MAGIKDIGWREGLIFAPLVVLTILFGIAPNMVLNMSAASVSHLLARYEQGVKAAEAERAATKLVQAPQAAPAKTVSVAQ
jgi:NADH-quinone oxidoreductase subunit M